MLDFVIIGFLVLSAIIIVFAVTGNSKNSGGKEADAVLTVTGETRIANKISSGTYEYTYDDLRTLAKGAEGGEYLGPPLRLLFSPIGLGYSSVLFFSAGSKKVQRLLQEKEIDDWIVAVEKDGKPLSWENDGPFLLLNVKDKSKRVPRLLRIEAK